MFNKISSNLWLLIAFICGAVSYYLNLPLLDSSAHIISDLFLKLLHLIALPIVFFAIISTMISMKSPTDTRYLFQKTFKYTCLTTLIASAIALGIFLLIQPVSITLTPSAAATHANSQGYLQYLLEIVPDNMLKPFLEGNVLAIAFLAAILSIAILQLPEKQQNVLKPLFEAIFNTMLTLTKGILRFLPIGIFAFSYLFFDGLNQTQDKFYALFLYTICIIGANLIQGAIILPTILKAKGIAPFPHFKAMLPAIITGLFSKSSSAALPLTLSCSEKAGVSKKISSFTLPLCSIINMNGCAAFITITTLFVAISSGVHFSLLGMFAFIFIASIAAIGNAGVPMGCYFLTSSILVSMHVDLTLMGLILPIYTIIDMIETGLNIYSDSCVAILVEKEQNLISPDTTRMTQNQSLV